MSRAAGALAVLILPGFLLSFLLALGERDWFHCFANAERADPPPLPSLFAPGELVPVLLETVTPPLSHPLMAALHFGPFLLFALFFFRARVPAQRRTVLAALVLFLLFSLWVLLPPAGQHACDRKGADALFGLPLFVIVGSVAALLANKLSCLTGACRHDPSRQ